MSFTQTTLLNKAGYFAFLSRANLATTMTQKKIVSLINAAQYIARNLLGTTPIMVTDKSNITIGEGKPPQSLLYCIMATPGKFAIETSANFRQAFAVINNTGETQSIIIDGYTQDIAPESMSFIILHPYRTYQGIQDYIMWDGVIPYGWTAEDMSLKVNKGDEVKISTGDTMVQSAITEVNLPGYEQFSFFTNGEPSAIDNTYISHCPTIGLIPSSLRYLLIVPVLPYNEFVDRDNDLAGVYAGVPIYQIDLLNGVTISQEWNANQPNKSTLSFKKDAGFNEEIAVPIYVE